MERRNRLIVFAKPWKFPIPELARRIAALGVDGVELPIRPGYPVNPENVLTALPEAVKVLADHGLVIGGAAGQPEERIIAACGAAGVPVLRICPYMGETKSYLEFEKQSIAEYRALAPMLDRHGVTLGLQNHWERYVPHAMALLRLCEPFDRRHVGAVWDPAHCALNGEVPEIAIDLVWSHLCTVNLKNAVWERQAAAGSGGARWRPHWAAGSEGLADWALVVKLLKERGYGGTICLPAEYSDESKVEELLPADVGYVKSLLAA